MPKHLTVEELGKILYEEFQQDDWGVIDPYYFKNPPKNAEEDPSGIGGLHEVLERVVKRLNKRLDDQPKQK